MDKDNLIKKVKEIHGLTQPMNISPASLIRRIHEICDEVLGHDEEYHQNLNHRKNTIPEYHKD